MSRSLSFRSLSNRPQSFRPLAGFALGLAVAAAGLSGRAITVLGDDAPAGDAKPRPTATSASGLLVPRCRIKLIDDATIAAGRTGVLADVLFREGDVVKKDQLVARLVDDVASAALDVATKEASNDIEIRYAGKAAEVAQAEHEAYVEANRRNAKTYPAIEVQKMKLAAERGVLQIEQAQHQFDIAKMKKNEAAATLKLFRVDAPFEATVTRVYKVKGEAVREGDPILELSNTSRVKVEGAIPIQDVFSVKPGASVSVQLDLPDVDLPEEQQMFAGKIVFVDVKAQPVTNDVRVWAEVDNSANVLRAGATARMTIQRGEPAKTARK